MAIHSNLSQSQKDKTKTMSNESNLSYSAFNIDGELQKHLNEIEDSLSDILPLSANNNNNTKVLQSHPLSSPNPQRISNRILLKTPSDNQGLEIELSLAVKGYPDILSFLDFNLKEMTLPDWITNKMLHDYYDYIQYANGLKCFINDSCNSQNNSNKAFNYKKLTKLANYFNNDAILKIIIECNIEPFIDQNNCFNLINDAFNYCSSSNHKDNAVNASSTSSSVKLSEKIRALWFKLFLALHSFIVTNLLSLSSNPKLLTLNTKLLDDIIESFLKEIYQKHIEISSDSALKLIKIIIQSKQINKSCYTNLTPIDEIDNDIFTYLQLSSDIDNDEINSSSNTQKNRINRDIINDLKENQPSIFSIDLLKDITHHYQEKPIQFDQQELLFSTHYDKNDDIFSVHLKLNSSNQLEVFSFISFTHLIEDKDYDRFYSKTLNGNMTVCIFKIISYKSYLDYMRSIKQFNTIQLEIKLKFNIVQTFTLFYLKSNFGRICRRETLAKLPMNTFQSLLTDVTCEKDEEPLLAIMNWLSDEMNRPEEVMGLMEDVNWKMIPLGRIFEFVMKCPRILVGNSRVENEIIGAIFDKGNRKMEEMKKDRMYQEVRFKNQMKMKNSDRGIGLYGFERNVTQMSYEGDIEKYKAIINVNGEDKDKETSSKKHEITNNNITVNTTEAQIGLISYFFVNLIECSKKINYPKLYFENKSLHNLIIQNDYSEKMKKNDKQGNDEVNNDHYMRSKEKLISVYKKDKINIFDFSQISDSGVNNRNKITKSPHMNSRNNIKGISSCDNDQAIKIPSIVMMTEQNNKKDSRLSSSNIKEHSSHSLYNISNMSDNSSSKRSLINSSQNNQNVKQSQPAIKLCSIVRGGNKSSRSNKNKEKEKSIAIVKEEIGSKIKNIEEGQLLLKSSIHNRNKSQTNHWFKDDNKQVQKIQVNNKLQSITKSQDIT